MKREMLPAAAWLALVIHNNRPCNQITAVLVVLTTDQRTSMTCPVTVETLNHPEKEEVFLRELEDTVVDNPEGEQLTPRAGDEEGDFDVLAGESQDSGLEGKDAVLAESVAAP